MVVIDAEPVLRVVRTGRDGDGLLTETLGNSVMGYLTLNIARMPENNLHYSLHYPGSLWQNMFHINYELILLANKFISML